MLKEDRKISSAQILLTARCNENCVHCLVNKETAVEELGTLKFKDILNQLSELGCMEVTFTGGEPFLRKDFFEIAFFAREKGMGIKIFTNGTLIDDVNVKMIKKLRPLGMQISLYGADPEIHDNTTMLKGSFEKSMRAVKMLKDNGIPVHISAIVMRHNFDRILALKEAAERDGTEIFTDPIIRPHESGSKEILKYRITDEQVNKAFGTVLAPAKCILKKIKSSETGESGLCVHNIGKSHVYISSTGEVFPDIGLGVKIGDLKRETLCDVWYDSEQLARLRNQKLSDFECSSCEHVYTCRWDQGLSLAEYGDMYKRPEEFCRFTKAALAAISPA